MTIKDKSIKGYRGQESFRIISRSFYRMYYNKLLSFSLIVGVLVFDVTDRYSFEMAQCNLGLCCNKIEIVIVGYKTWKAKDKSLRKKLKN